MLLWPSVCVWGGGECNHNKKHFQLKIMKTFVIIRSIERWVSDTEDENVVTCLPESKVVDITCHVDRLLVNVVVGHVGTNNVRKCSPRVLEARIYAAR